MIIISNPTIPFVLQNEIMAAAEETTIVTPPVPPGSVFVAHSVMAMDLTTAIVTRIEIGIMDGNKKIPIDSTPGSFAARTSHTIYWPCVVSAGQRLYATFLTPTAADQVVINAFGVLESVVTGHEKR